MSTELKTQNGYVPWTELRRAMGTRAAQQVRERDRLDLVQVLRWSYEIAHNSVDGHSSNCLDACWLKDFADGWDDHPRAAAKLGDPSTVVCPSGL